MSDHKKYTNRLSQEQSPYLLQHAHNPVDWYAWGPEAFGLAAKEDKPILLSIGYSTCHWCHVMERESFENEAIAKLMNEYFVSIKVDREERPDLDGIYMAAVTAITGQGGWPLTAFLTPDLKPFYGGTYFPPEPRWGSPGFKDILLGIHDAWVNKREQLILSSQAMTAMLNEKANKKESFALSPDILGIGFKQFSSFYDSAFGGFGQQPKFPSSHNLSFLLGFWKRSSNADALGMVEKTLYEMYKGGMHDHLGGGFHRYSTDREWQIPHFEKMLYDQAILARTYLEAYQITKNPLYEQVARDIFDYVLRDMTDPAGGFYSAEDADSYDPEEYLAASARGEQLEKFEGAFYLWKQKELEQLLSAEEFNIFSFHFGIKPDGNAKLDPQGEFTGKNVLFIERSLEETAAHFQKPFEDVEKIIEQSKKKLFQIRSKRPRPHLDDKVLTDWNGLMISAFSFGARVLNEPRYRQAAEKAAQFLLKTFFKGGRLLHRWRKNEAGIEGTLSDYAFFIHSLLDMYETTFEQEYLKTSIVLADKMIALFWDNSSGGFFISSAESKDLIVRQKDLYDGAIPSGNSMAALDLVRLFHFTLESKWEEKGSQALNTFSGELAQRPGAYGQMLIALDFYLGPAMEIILSAEKENALIKDMLQAVWSVFIPKRVVILRTEANVNELKETIPSIEAKNPINHQPTAFVCENHVCQLPITSLAELLASLRK